MSYRRKLAEQLESHDLGFARGYRLRIIEVLEGTGPRRWIITARAQRLNLDGSVDARDTRPRVRSFMLEAIETLDGEPFPGLRNETPDTPPRGEPRP